MIKQFPLYIHSAMVCQHSKQALWCYWLIETEVPSVQVFSVVVKLYPNGFECLLPAFIHMTSLLLLLLLLLYPSLPYNLMLFMKLQRIRAGCAIMRYYLLWWGIGLSLFPKIKFEWDWHGTQLAQMYLEFGIKRDIPSEANCCWLVIHLDVPKWLCCHVGKMSHAHQCCMKYVNL